MEDRIWITAKTRMEAEKRYRLYDVFSHALLAWYSICLLGISIYLPTSELDSVLSAGILVLSSIIWGMRFGETAAHHRYCYLDLDSLLSEKLGEDVEIRYQGILSKYPNHSPIDYHCMLFNRITMGGQHIISSGETVSFGRRSSAKYLARILVGWLFGLVAFLAPLLAAIAEYYL